MSRRLRNLPPSGNLPRRNVKGIAQMTDKLPPPSHHPALQKGVLVKDDDDLHGTVILSFKNARELRKYCAALPVPVLLDFGATWCGPCRSMARALEKLEAHFAGRLMLLQIDIDKAPRIAEAYDVASVPLLVLVSGKKILTRFEGAHSFTELKRALEKHLPSTTIVP
jgi:thiol-disulfide isomerase/thioredoxin